MQGGSKTRPFANYLPPHFFYISLPTLAFDKWRNIPCPGYYIQRPKLNLFREAAKTTTAREPSEKRLSCLSVDAAQPSFVAVFASLQRRRRRAKASIFILQFAHQLVCRLIFNSRGFPVVPRSNANTTHFSGFGQ
jgi:hypothetical protein